MRICFGLAVLILTAPCRSETPAYDEAKVVAYAKTIDIAQLDPTLESESFEKWLRLGSAHMEKLQWSMSDCDLKPDYVEPPDGYPLCTRVAYQRGRVAGWIIVTIGTTRKGIVGPPRFEYAVVSTPASAGMKVEDAEKLAELPQVISRILAQTK